MFFWGHESQDLLFWNLFWGWGPLCSHSGQRGVPRGSRFFSTFPNLAKRQKKRLPVATSGPIGKPQTTWNDSTAVVFTSFRVACGFQMGPEVAMVGSVFFCVLQGWKTWKKAAAAGTPQATKRKLQNRPSIAQGRARLSVKSVNKLRIRLSESLISQTPIS